VSAPPHNWLRMEDATLVGGMRCGEDLRVPVDTNGFPPECIQLPNYASMAGAAFGPVPRDKYELVDRTKGVPWKYAYRGLAE
jgi:hypothetical protein